MLWGRRDRAGVSSPGGFCYPGAFDLGKPLPRDEQACRERLGWRQAPSLLLSQAPCWGGRKVKGSGSPPSPCLTLAPPVLMAIRTRASIFLTQHQITPTGRLQMVSVL